MRPRPPQRTGKQRTALAYSAICGLCGRQTTPNPCKCEETLIRALREEAVERVKTKGLPEDRAKSLVMAPQRTGAEGGTQTTPDEENELWRIIYGQFRVIRGKLVFEDP